MALLFFLDSQMNFPSDIFFADKEIEREGRQQIPALFKERVALTPPREASYFIGRGTGYGYRSPKNEKVSLAPVCIAFYVRFAGDQYRKNIVEM
jgi:hypothetical protein